jgi:hypothetical protein
VFLRGIPAATTEEELHGVFGKFGNIVKVAIIPSRTYDTNTAYVDYDTTQAVQAAMDAYGSDRGEGNEEKLVHRLSLRGKSVTVLLKLPRTLRPQPVTMGGRGGDFRRGPPGSYNRGGGLRWGACEGGKCRQPATSSSIWLTSPCLYHSVVHVVCSPDDHLGALRRPTSVRTSHADSCCCWLAGYHRLWGRRARACRRPRRRHAPA